MMARKPNICITFDGPIHSYTSGWKGVKTVADGPTEGALEWITSVTDHVILNIVSPRAREEGGIDAMQIWLAKALVEAKLKLKGEVIDYVTNTIKWPTTNPPANMYIDDRAFTFNGDFPTVDQMLAFKPNRGKKRTEFAPIAQAIMRAALPLHDGDCLLSGGDGSSCPACDIEKIVRPYT